MAIQIPLVRTQSHGANITTKEPGKCSLPASSRTEKWLSPHRDSYTGCYFASTGSLTLREAHSEILLCPLAWLGRQWRSEGEMVVSVELRLLAMCRVGWFRNIQTLYHGSKVLNMSPLSGHWVLHTAQYSVSLLNLLEKQCRDGFGLFFWQSSIG